MFETMRLADDKKVDEGTYKLIFYISEIVLAPPIWDMRGSTVHCRFAT